MGDVSGTCKDLEKASSLGNTQVDEAKKEFEICQ